MGSVWPAAMFGAAGNKWVSANRSSVRHYDERAGFGAALNALPRYTVSFRGYAGGNFDPSEVQDAEGKTITINHYTGMFRDDKLFAQLPGFLHKRFPQGTTIHCYGASRGEEPISLAMALIDHLGVDEARKFRIIASDLVPAIMDRGRAGVIGAQGNTYTGPFQLMNQQASEVLKTRPLSDYVDPAPLGPDYDALRSTLYNEKIFKVRPWVKDLLDEMILYRDEPVNFIEVAKKSFPLNSVVMFRNAFYLLDGGIKRTGEVKVRRQVIENLGKSMPPGSLLIVGSSEYNPDLNPPGHPWFDEMVKESGFEPVTETDFTMSDVDCSLGDFSFGYTIEPVLQKGGFRIPSP